MCGHRSLLYRLLLHFHPPRRQSQHRSSLWGIFHAFRVAADVLWCSHDNHAPVNCSTLLSLWVNSGLHVASARKKHNPSCDHAVVLAVYAPSHSFLHEVATKWFPNWAPWTLRSPLGTSKMSPENVGQKSLISSLFRPLYFILLFHKSIRLSVRCRWKLNHKINNSKKFATKSLYSEVQSSVWTLETTEETISLHG